MKQKAKSQLKNFLIKKLPNSLQIAKIRIQCYHNKRKKWLRKSPDQLTPGDLLDEHSQRNYYQSFQPKIKKSPLIKWLKHLF